MRKLNIVIILALGLAVFAVASTAFTKGKPPPPPTEGGTIYYSDGFDLYSMATDGSGKTLLLSNMKIRPEPSEFLHAGERWFLSFIAIAGETYPDGSPRHELAAISETGMVVQLSDDPTLQPTDDSGRGEVVYLSYPAPRWSKEDMRVSYVARRWSSDPTPVVVEVGIYKIDLDVDVANSPMIVAPTRLPLALDAIDTVRGPLADVDGYDWAPDGSNRLVYGGAASDALRRANLDTGDVDVIYDLSEAAQPRWSANSQIIFWAQGGPYTRALLRINADGSGLILLVDQNTKRRPVGTTGTMPADGVWSPSETPLLTTVGRLTSLATGGTTRWMSSASPPTAPTPRTSPVTRAVLQRS